LPFSIADQDLLSAEFTLWNLVSNRAYMLQMLNRSYIPAGSYEFTWSGNVTAIAATPNPLLVTLLPWRDVSTGGTTAPILKAVGTIASGGESLYAELLVNATTLRAELALIYLGDLPTMFPIASLAGSDTVFWPMFVYVDVNSGDAFVETGQTGVTLPGDAVTFTAAGLGTGSYAFSLQAKDTWGNATTQFYNFTLP
jgi:hypothetical protein